MFFTQRCQGRRGGVGEGIACGAFVSKLPRIAWANYQQKLCFCAVNNRYSFKNTTTITNHNKKEQTVQRAQATRKKSGGKVFDVIN